jgi:hypothetical protein
MGFNGSSVDDPEAGFDDTLSATCPLPMKLEVEGDQPYSVGAAAQLLNPVGLRTCSAWYQPMEPSNVISGFSKFALSHGFNLYRSTTGRRRGGTAGPCTATTTGWSTARARASSVGLGPFTTLLLCVKTPAADSQWLVHM